MITIRDLSKVFGKREAEALAMAGQGAGRAEILAATGATLALNQVSLDIPAGQVFVLMGLSGSGKSTLVRHLNRLVEPSRGAIEIGGEDILALDAKALRQLRRQKISMVFQGFGLLPHLSVRDNIAFGLIARGEPKAEAHDKARQWITTLGLDGYQDARPDALSGGMRQRVGLGRALAVDTGILLMDEAFSALDPLIRAEMQDMLQDLQRRLKKTVVFVTHDLAEAVRLGDTIAMLRDGAVVQVGAPDDILNHPADDYVARFVAAHRR
ncbi:betaine/proline/choline family ABC transporter ATP-binding protein [Asticcacaulis sp. EMRT-3]|uniref:betaine/proline/choline family ABC transporter ATP-binding protein n=1 Tax=Asticcacaulis sp. EMRT-3 TaxID=3040349 RepID=UPI0024AFA0A7|nr:betaine/proline/choline family ABC transporter ATP-binding protein [Asticcacaulis sp. EMRT-3]MDI7775024.1 betaine/proline/choline family ABC transporter ATP-binding protein [Asticcacaulis sp. EMRT-3]